MDFERQIRVIDLSRSLGEIGDLLQTSIQKIKLMHTEHEFSGVVKEIISLIDKFTKLFDFEKTEGQQEDFEKSRKIFGRFLVEFMSNIGKNEHEFL